MIRGWSERRQLKRDEFGMGMLKKMEFEEV